MLSIVVNIDKSHWRIKSHDLRFISPIFQTLSFDYIGANTLTKNLNSHLVMLSPESIDVVR